MKEIVMNSFRFEIVSMLMILSMVGYARGLTVFDDNFDSYSIGDQINTFIPTVGEWGSTAVVTNNSAHTVQANPLGAGQVLRGVRFGTGGSTGFPTARTNTAPEENTTVTISWDTFRPDAGSGASVQALYLGITLFVDTNINPNQNTQEIRYNAGSGNVLTGVLTGFGGWERWEMEITWGPADGGGLIYPTFDLFFERLDANNSQGILPKTQLANDVPTYVSGVTAGVGNMRWLYGLNAHWNNTPENPVDSIVYFDNILIDVASALHPGDANGDGMVNLSDLQILGDHWQSTTATWAEADFTGDGNVNLADLQILGDNWGFGAGPDVTFDEALGQLPGAIPEPATAALLLIGGVLWLRPRK
ncbi:MAG: hypothetical protein IT445_09505 [Phycisphaeraceae bacterium]|nr:hypothetical protein [Phycisphaeraceae bacterium]